MLNFDLQCYADNVEEKPERYLYVKGDYDGLRSYLGKTSWKDMDDLDANTAWEFFADRLHEGMNKHIPKSKPTKTSDKRRWKPLWMCGKVLKKVKKKYHAWKRYTATKQYEDYQIYVKLRNAATYGVRSAKREFEKKLADEIKVNPKSFWSYVRSKTKVKKGISDLDKEDGTRTQNDEEKADVLNKFFASVFTREDLENIPDPEMKFDGTPLEGLNISSDEVLKKLMKMNPSKSPGPDGVHPRVLKETAECIVEPLTTIFNKSLHEGKVPLAWKVAHVTAIYKKGKATSPGNYRPVSLTSIVCKMMESILRDQIMKFMDECNLLSEHQHGFRSGRSCVTQLIAVLDEWTGMIEEEGGVDVAYLDFSKAFDSVPHQRLLKKVRAHGISGNLLNWIQSFLAERRQCVVINGKRFAWEKVISGIPQGSVLGPILFVIYINDLPDVLKGHVKMFADDTKVFTHIRDQKDSDILQEDLDSLSKWSDRWQLRFNVEKCGIMHYGRQEFKTTYSMEGGGSRKDLEVREEEKDLGVTFDPTLKFSKHVGDIANKANRDCWSN